MNVSRQIFFVGLVLTGAACAFPIHAQHISVDSLTSKFDRYRNGALQEKMFLHLDQSFHLTGEMLWFKIYSVEGSYHKPLAVSTVAYVELIDAKNTSLLQEKIQIKNGVGAGSFFLPATLTSANYQVRAYTEWMKNAGVDFFFHQPVTVVNPFLKLEEVEVSKARADHDVQFFPEGGHWVAGLKSKVAFRATDPSGKGIDFKGFILNGQKDTLVKFTPFKFGIGHFEFTPVAGQDYTASIIDSKGKRSSVKLPEVEADGFTLRLSENANQIEIEVIDSELRQESVYLFAHARLIKIKAETQFLRNGKASFFIEKSNLPEGISHFTLFNKDLQPVCERLYFKVPQKKLAISINGNKDQYEKRERIKLDIHASPSSHLSVSVFHVDSLSSLANESIFENLWLSSDLKGVIESPSFYFDVNHPEAREAADNLMLTHGWRRFNWNQVLLPAPPFKFMPELHGPILKGKIMDASGAPANGIVAYLASPSKTVKFYGAISNREGFVHYEMKNLYGSQKIILQTDRPRDTTYRIEMETPFLGQFASRQLPSFTLLPSTGDKLLTRSVSMQVQSSYFQDEDRKLINTSVDSIAFFGTADETYYLDDYTRFPIMEEVMREYVPGVLVRKRKDSFYFLVLDKMNKSVFRENSLILLDGVPVFDVNKIMAFDPLNVKSLEVINRTYYLGSITFPGIVSYRTYEGDLGGFQLDPEILTLDYEGLQQQREFYSPRYDRGTDRKRIPDERSLLYWNPGVTPGKNGSAPLEFYSSDKVGTFQVVIQGIASDGAAGYATYSFTIK